MCREEPGHETIAIPSFLPLPAVPFDGALPVFLSVSCLAAVFDLCFAVLQRYSRPRLLRILVQKKTAELFLILFIPL